MSGINKKLNDGKTLDKFSDLFGVKWKTFILLLCSSVIKHKTFNKEIFKWYIIQNIKGYKIRSSKNQAMKKWIVQHPKVVESRMKNNGAKVTIYFCTDKSCIESAIVSVCQITSQQPFESNILGWYERSEGKTK